MSGLELQEELSRKTNAELVEITVRLLNLLELYEAASAAGIGEGEGEKVVCEDGC